MKAFYPFGLEKKFRQQEFLLQFYPLLSQCLCRRMMRNQNTRARKETLVRKKPILGSCPHETIFNLSPSKLLSISYISYSMLPSQFYPYHLNLLKFEHWYILLTVTTTLHKSIQILFPSHLHWSIQTLQLYLLCCYKLFLK